MATLKPDKPMLYKVTLMSLPAALSVVLVFWNLKGLGLCHWDEYNYIITAKWFLGGRDGVFTIYEPPGFPFLVSLFFKMFGVEDYVAIASSGVFAVLTVILVTIIGFKMFSFEVGFGAPLLLTTSALFLFYSRMALTDIAFTFFFTAATISLYKAFRSGRIRDTVYAGLISAGCMAIKYNGFMPLIVAASYAPIMVRGARDHEKPRQLIKYLTQLLVASLPTLAFIVLFLSLLGVGGGIGGIASMRTVKILASSFPDLISKGYARFHVAIEAHRGQLRPIPLIEAPFYIRVLVKWVPLPTLLFTLIGLASCDFKKVDESFASYWLLLTFALISSIPARYSRAILPALPPLSLTSALGIAKLPTMLRPFLKRLVRPELWMNPHKKPMLALTILLLIAVSSLPSVKDTVAMSHNAYRDAGQILKSRAQGYTVIAETQPIIAFYHPVDFWRIKGDNLPEEGFIVVDHIAAVYGDHEVVRKLEVEGRIELVAAIVNDSPDIVYLDTVSFDELPKIKEDLNYTTIRIYKIK